MTAAETPVREIELEGHKVRQYDLSFSDALGDFALTPIFPTQQYLDSYFDEYKKTANKEELKSIESFLGTPARSISFPSLEFLFSRDKLVSQGKHDSWRDLDVWWDFVKRETQQYAASIRNPRKELGKLQPVIDKLQLVFEQPHSEALPAVYKTAVKTIDMKHADTPNELAYIEFLEGAMARFEELLYRNVGVGFGLYDIRLFNILYRKQELFAGRILAYDLPRIIRKNDTELDRILTPLLALGWGMELAHPFPKTSQEIQELAVRFLTLYLAAQTARAFYERDTEREKKEAQRLRNEDVVEHTFSSLEYEDDEGNHWLEPAKSFILAAKQAKIIALQENFSEKRNFLKKIGSNRILRERKVFVLAEMPWKILANLPAEARSAEAASFQHTIWLPIQTPLKLLKLFYQT